MIIDTTESISIADYYYYYSQLLLAIGTIFLSGLLVLFAAKDYEETFVKEFKMDFEISNIIYLVSTKKNIYLHVPITIINLSRKPGWINDVCIKILSNNDITPLTELSSSYFVNIRDNYEIIPEQKSCKILSNNKSYNDGLPFTNVPLKGEEVLREFITLRQVKGKEVPALPIFSEDTEYKIEIYLKDINGKNTHSKAYTFFVDKELHEFFKKTVDQDGGSNRYDLTIEKCIEGKVESDIS